VPVSNEQILKKKLNKASNSARESSKVI